MEGTFGDQEGVVMGVVLGPGRWEGRKVVAEGLNDGGGGRRQRSALV